MVELGVFNYYNWPLIFIGFIWMLVAIIMDFRKREVANFWNFSLIVVALVYRSLLSVSLWDYRFFMFGLVGFGVGFLLANLFYYMRVFAGGDAKLLMALGVVLPLSLDWVSNCWIFLLYIILFLLAGGVYGLIASFVLSILNWKEFKEEFGKGVRKYKLWIVLFLLVGSVFLIVGCFSNWSLYLFGGLVFVFPLLLVYAQAVQEASLIKKVSVKDLTIGDWLAKEVKVGNQVIKKHWEGLNEKDLKLLSHFKGKVLVKYGIPFTPSFLIAYGLLFWLLAKGFYILLV